MLIKKILNNNVVITINDDHEEIIVMGKGIAYGKRNGDLIDISKINKTFELSLKDEQKKMQNMLKDIPIEYMDTSDQIIQKAKKELKVGIDDSLYITLTDHIHTSIERYKEGVILKNQLLMEIKSFYRKEFELGMWALTLIKAKYGISMDENEAGFIALHIVCSETDNAIENAYEITAFIKEILEIVKNYFHIEFDEESLSYYSFVTHLKYFGLRCFNHMKHNQIDSLNNDILEIMKEKYVDAYLCVLEIKKYVKQKYDYILEDEEILFLTIHVAKIILKK